MIKKKNSEEEFIERLDKVYNFYTEHFKDLAPQFIEKVRPLSESWYKTKIRFEIEAELDKLLDHYLFDEAEECFKKNIDYIDERRYRYLVAFKINEKISTLLSQFFQLQKDGFNRVMWNQDYAQRMHDDELIALSSKYLSESSRYIDQFKNNHVLHINVQKDTIALFRDRITELENLLKNEAAKEADTIKALNVPWDTVLSLHDIATL